MIDDVWDGVDVCFDGLFGGVYLICWEGEGKVFIVLYIVIVLYIMSVCDMCVWIVVKFNCV